MLRLDRLILLLDTGSTVVRNTAAEQLALVQKAHPHEFYNLLGRIVPYLKYDQWDTRIAAAKAIGGIIENTPQFDPNALVDDKAHLQDDEVHNGAHASETSKNDSAAMDETKPGLPTDSSTAQQLTEEDEKLCFETFDIMNVVKNGERLLGSAGKEYEWSTADLSPEERLARAKQNITERLGLGAGYMDKDLITEHDLSTPNPTRAPPSTAIIQIPIVSTKVPHHESVIPSSPATPIMDESLSARQRNMMKRKAKVGGKMAPNKIRVVDVSTSAAGRRGSQFGDHPPTSTPSLPNGPDNDYFSITPQTHASAIVVEHKKPLASPASVMQASAQKNGWPLDGLVELLIVNLFDPKWEIRHGAALALREVFRFQSFGAGRRLRRSISQNDAANKAYLDDIACRLCCLFALDRFGDYVSDQVVAPIRETVSQTLAALLRILPERSVKSTFDILSSLVFQPGVLKRAWEVTHGGMLGMKYLVAIRKDVLSSSTDMFGGIVAAVLHALADQDDDVRAVGAATLIPIAEEFVANQAESVPELLDVLWECLADLKDDLSASTGSVMDLLAKLCSIPAVLQVMQLQSAQSVEHSFATLVPRLYPFFRHTITSVRRAVFKALRTILTADRACCTEWVDSRFLRLLFQVLLVEQNDDVLGLAQNLWSECVSTSVAQSVKHTYEVFSSCVWTCVSLTLTPIGYGRTSIGLDLALFVRPSGQAYNTPQIKSQDSKADSIPKTGGRRKQEHKTGEVVFTHNIDSPVLSGDVELVSYENLLVGRLAAATALGKMYASWPDDVASQAVCSLLKAFKSYAASTSRFVLTILVQEFAASHSNPSRLIELQKLLETLMADSAASHYSNLVPLLRVVRGQCQALCVALSESGRIAPSKIPTLPIICEGEPDAGPAAFNISMADKFIVETCERIASNLKGNMPRSIEDTRISVLDAIDVAKQAKTIEDIRIDASISAAYLTLGHLPTKLNPIIKALMDSVKKEESLLMQQRSASALATLVSSCSTTGRRPAADKLVKNLCAFLCLDTSETPDFSRHVKMKDQIYSLKLDHTANERLEASHSREIREARVKRTGAQMALEEMATRFQGELFHIVPKLQECIFTPLRVAFGKEIALTELEFEAPNLGQDLIDGLFILRVLLTKLDAFLLTHVFEALPLIFSALQCEYSTIRHAAAICFAQICKIKPVEGMNAAITTVLPMLADAGNSRKRQGAIEAVNFLVSYLDVAVLPYVIFLIVPVLGRMSDSDNDTRILATTTFAMLVKLVPLEAGIPDPPGFSKELLASRDNERKFIQQMLDGSKVEAFKIPVAIKANLRSYQQDGVNWLAFLNKYQLHGILCDDMGLGKTLQTICIIASDHYNRRLKFQETTLREFRHLPSLVICPPSLSGHWQQEIQTYAPFLSCVCYVGPPKDRKGYRANFDQTDVIVTSYDIARNDIEFLAKKIFNYCVLDEGHIIKNSEAKLTQAVKSLKANHRLILSGTPIQNNVLELWSLFDFLMPGFLGTESSFLARYARAIANSRDSKSSSKEQEAGAIALEALHKQVLPFLLRRLKEEVLSDLPPKIIQDYYCELSPLQKSLYNDFATSQASKVAEETTGGLKKEAKTHVFQALQYMRKLCNHPALVMKEGHPKYLATMKNLAAQSQSLTDIQHAPKLLALRDLLLDCGIGVTAATKKGSSPSAVDFGSAVVNQHRALIFCQIKDMLDLVENDVLKKLLPTVSYMRLDGTIDPRNRQNIVQNFNADPSIDVLLLTTHVGGLGLNLTGADTVIFVEHDWNPMKDLQAMDRAHRLGQKNTVNVYRLITRGTLEEKIMGLQRFKINIASSIVNQQNSGLATMETNQILDLFNVSESNGTQVPSQVENGVDAEGNIIKKGRKSVFDDLETLHDESEYAFDVDDFVKTL